jgi:hypothetical protein
MVQHRVTSFGVVLMIAYVMCPMYILLTARVDAAVTAQGQIPTQDPSIKARAGAFNSESLTGVGFRDPTTLTRKMCPLSNRPSDVCGDTHAG